MTITHTLDVALEQLKIAGLNFGYAFIKDVNARMVYLRNIKEMSDGLLEAYRLGKMSAQEAAGLAQQSRNSILELSRARLSRLGLSYSENLKKQGKALAELLDYYADKKYGKTFDALDDAAREATFVEVIKASGRDRGSVTRMLPKLRAAGRVLWVLSIAVAGYNIFTSDNKPWASGREAATLGGGFGGGAVGGAAAGIWFGPIGVAAGIVIGGALGALVSDEAYLAAAGPEIEAAAGVINKYAGFFTTDEKGMADALYDRGIIADEVYLVFLELDDNYNGDADDVALLYVENLKEKGGIAKTAVAQHTSLVNLLVRILEQGWTSGREESAISYLRSL